MAYGKRNKGNNRQSNSNSNSRRSSRHRQSKQEFQAKPYGASGYYEIFSVFANWDGDNLSISVGVHPKAMKEDGISKQEFLAIMSNFWDSQNIDKIGGDSGIKRIYGKLFEDRDGRYCDFKGNLRFTNDAWEDDVLPVLEDMEEENPKASKTKKAKVKPKYDIPQEDSEEDEEYDEEEENI